MRYFYVQNVSEKIRGSLRPEELAWLPLVS